MKINGWKYGAKLGRKVQAITAAVYWLSGTLRKWKYHRLYEIDQPPKFQFIKKFISGFKAQYSISLVKCEDCRDAVGIDHYSEKHGWHYHGYHIWSCPKCMKGKKNAS